VRLSYDAWAALIERRHRAILAGSALVCLLSALALLRVRLDFDVLSMLPRGRPAFDDFKRFVAEFGQLNELLVLVHAEPGTVDGAADPPPSGGARLSRLQAFADAFGAGVAALDTVASVQVRVESDRLLEGVLGRYLYNYLPENVYDTLEKDLTPAGIEARLAASRAMLSAPLALGVARAVREDLFGLRRGVVADLEGSRGQSGPSLRDGYLTAPGGDALLVFVRPRASAFDTAFSARLLDQVREVEGRTRGAMPDAGVRVAYTGSYVYALEDAAALRRDVRRYTLLALVGVLAVFYLGYRNLRILPFVTYPLLVSTLLAFPADLLVYGQLNAVSLSFAAILYGLSIDVGVHFYNRLLEERRRLPARAAVAATLAGLLRPTLAASTTSAIVFVIIGFSCMAGVSQLGVLTAFGVMLNPLQLLVLYPALAFFLPRSVEARDAADVPRLAGLAAAVSSRGGRVCAAAAVMGAALVIAAARVPLDVGFTHLRPSVSAASRVQGEIEERFGKQALGGAVLVRRADLETALADGERVAHRLERYRRMGRVQSIGSVAAVLPSARAQGERLARFNRLPRRAAMQALRAALPRHGFAAQPFEPFISGFEREHHEILRPGDPALAPLAPLIDRYVREQGGMYTVATHIEPAASESLVTLAERLRRDLAGMDVSVTGRTLLEGELRSVLRDELRAFLLLALVGNVILLLATFGLADTVVIIGPVGWAIAALLAGMSLTGAALNPVNLVVPTLILGLGVDYGAFMVAAAREAGPMAGALRRNGRALVVSGLTTAVGFGALSLSRYPALSSMGLLAATGLLLALASSLVLVPALWAALRWRSRG
jgi:predicted RND superfamily exporter protein